MHVKQILEAEAPGPTRALQVLGAGLLAGLLGGIASHKFWMGVCFAAGGILVTLSAIDYKCAALAAHQPRKQQDKLTPRA